MHRAKQFSGEGVQLPGQVGDLVAITTTVQMCRAYKGQLRALFGIPALSGSVFTK